MWRRRLSSLLKPAAELCSISHKENLSGVTNRSQMLQQMGQSERLVSDTNRLVEGLIGSSEIAYLYGTWRQKICPMNAVDFGYLNQVARVKSFQSKPCMYRSFSSSSAPEKSAKNQNKARKDISTVEDPFDSPTYHIPEKPVTFTEGASYTLVILVGLGIAAAAAYAVFSELIFQPKEYMIFNKALDRVQNDSQVRVRIGSPIKGYGQESRNRAARQRIPNRRWIDEDGVEHVEVMFFIRGPHGGGQVRSEMFKDKADNQWKFTFLIVDILSPSQAQLILESFIPS